MNGKDRMVRAGRELSQAFALAVPHAEALRIRDDVAFFQGVQTDAHLRQFARHIVAEQREYVETAGKERKLVWVVVSKQNHWLDCSSEARCAASILGIKLVEDKPKPPPRPVIEVVNNGAVATSNRPGRKPGRKKGYKLSAATRRKMSLAAKRRYAGGAKSETPAAGKRKRKPFSAETRAKMAAAQQRRWAKVKGEATQASQS